MLGACSLKSVDWARGVAEGGYWVVPWARGRKVAQRAVRLMCDWALAEVGLRQLEFFVEPANAASCAVVENLGCAREELVRDKEVIRGTRRDIARYALQK